jgi:hypothetical protein
MCEEMPEDHKTRRLLDVGAGLYGDSDQTAGYGYGSDLDGSYGAYATRAIFEPPQNCGTCLGIFEQCAGEDTVAACCAGELLTCCFQQYCSHVVCCMK